MMPETKQRERGQQGNREDIRQIPNRLNLAFMESLYVDYLRNPASVAPEWRRYFEGMPGDESFRRAPCLSPHKPARGPTRPARMKHTVIAAEMAARLQSNSPSRGL